MNTDREMEGSNMSANIDGGDGRVSRRRVMGRLDVTLFMVSAILVIDQLTASASIGASAVGWWVVTIVLFLVPSALLTGELATAYPYQGGIYDWIHRAFGRSWAARTTYWYWVNVALWMPSVYLLLTGAMKSLFWEGATTFQQSLVAVGLVWSTVVIGLQTLQVGKRFTSASALLKVVVIAVIGVGGIYLAVRDGAANSLTVDSMLPDFSVTKTFLPVLVYQLLGFELVSSMSGELRDPERDIPKAIPAAGLLLSALYVLGTVGILLALPLKQIGLTEGIVDTLKVVFGGTGVAVWILALVAMATYLGNMITWTLGANRSAVEAAAAGELPRAFARENHRGAPLVAYLLTGVIATAVLLGTGLFISDQDSLYFAIFAASSAIFLLPYCLLYPAVAVLRRRDPDRRRPFRVPGGAFGLWASVVLATGAVFASLVLFVWTPGEPVDWTYTGPLIAIVIGSIVVGELLVGWSLRRPGAAAETEAADVVALAVPDGDAPVPRTVPTTTVASATPPEPRR
jgi:amino acid transporter